MTPPRGADAEPSLSVQAGHGVIIGGNSVMPINEELRLECLRLASGTHHGDRSDAIVDAASRYYDFVTGIDRAALTEQAKAAVDALR